MNPHASVEVVCVQEAEDAVLPHSPLGELKGRRVDGIAGELPAAGCSTASDAGEKLAMARSPDCLA